ncbi:MAG: hypothetical protein MUO40_07440 [Anaerolineaceae bacterium]|nr:hypothetical protein [Anaerolineaceae bacterium]
MKKFTSIALPVIGGILLVALGSLMLLNNFNVIQLNFAMLIGPVIAVGGLVFLLVFIFDRKHWWSLIPGCVLLGIGATVFLGTLDSSLAGFWSPAIIFFALGLSFWLIYVNNTSNWWAIIPGGVLWSLALSSLLPQGLLLSSSAFFLGIGLTFLLVWILPKPEGRMKWALYPAGSLLLVGIITTFGAINWLRFIWPIALLIGGGILLYLAIRKKA